REVGASDGLGRLAVERRGVRVDVSVGLDVGGVAAPARLDRLIDELARGPDRHEREEPLDVLRVGTNATVAHLAYHAPRNVRAMDAVHRQRQLDAVLAERVVRVAAGDEGAGVTPVLDVLLADRLRDVPLRVHGLPADTELAARRPPVVASEPHGEGV